MIFKKTPLQGNFIFSDGQQALFAKGYFETEDESQIQQLKKIYEEVKEIPQESAGKEAPAESAALAGMASSATLAALTKANK